MENNLIKQAFVLGDLHGDYKPVKRLYERNKELIDNMEEKPILILLGDVGLNYSMDWRDEYVKKQLSKLPFIYFVIRGNHEERPCNMASRFKDNWTKEKEFEADVWVEYKFPNIKYAMDYPEVYKMCGNRVLSLPGAYSVDKDYRLMTGRSWFPSEQLTQKEKMIGWNIVEENNHFDCILSHTCPLEYRPVDLFLDFIDQSKVDISTEQYLSEIAEVADYGAWCWGHYHSYREYPHDEPGIRVMLSNDYAIDFNELMKGNVVKL